MDERNLTIMQKQQHDNDFIDQNNSCSEVLIAKTNLAETKAEAHLLTVNDFNSRCVLLQDATLQEIPLHLRQLLKACDTSEMTESEILFLLVYVVALEMGFTTEQEYAKCLDKIVQLQAISSYHSKNVQLLSQQSPTYVYDKNKSMLSMRLRTIIETIGDKELLLKSLLTAVGSGDFLIVTLTNFDGQNKSGYSLCLSINRYVLGNLSNNCPIQQRFRKLDELSLKLRDELFLPVRNNQMILLGAPLYPSLLGLPAEMYEEIFKYLKKNDIRTLSHVNKHLHYYCNCFHSIYRKKRTWII